MCSSMNVSLEALTDFQNWGNWVVPAVDVHSAGGREVQCLSPSLPPPEATGWTCGRGAGAHLPVGSLGVPAASEALPRFVASAPSRQRLLLPPKAEPIGLPESLFPASSKSSCAHGNFSPPHHPSSEKREVFLGILYEGFCHNAELSTTLG